MRPTKLVHDLFCGFSFPYFFIFILQDATSMSDGFTWMHVHQTWLEESEPKDHSTWLL
jgi:hypothetical protein